MGGVYSYLHLQRCPLLHAANSELWPTAANTARAHALLNSCAALAVPKAPWETYGTRPPSKQEQRTRTRQSVETNKPSPEKHSNTISVPAQQFLVSSMLHSAPSASLSKRLPPHQCLTDLVVNIGPVAGICLGPPAAHVLAIHVAAPAAAAVMAFPALPADLCHLLKRK